MEKENEELSRELQNCKSKQEVEEVELQYLKMIRSWCGLAGNDTSASAEERLEYTLFQDAAITAIKNIVHEFTESDRYRKLPDHMDRIPSGDSDMAIQPDSLL